MSTHAASDVAEVYEAWGKATKRELEGFVVDNPQWYNLYFAWNMANSIDLVGVVAVDLLRLGEGAAESVETGSILPAVQDVGRAASIAGPLARGLGWGANAGARGLQFARARMFFKTTHVTVGGPCIPTTLDRALILAGRGNGGRLFARFSDYLRALGKSESAFAKAQAAGANARAADLLAFLRARGVRIAPVFGISTEAALKALVGRSRNVVTFAIRWLRPDGTKAGHQVLAYRNLFGEVVFGDGYGREMKTLAEVAARWRGTNVRLMASDTPLLLPYADLIGAELFRLADGAVVFGLGVLSGVSVIHTPDGPDIAVDLAIPPQEPPATMTQGVLKAAGGAAAMRAQGRPVLRMPPIEIVGRPTTAPPRPDWLTGVQWRLNALGFGAGRVDGIMGRRTRAAVRAFQRDQVKGGQPLATDGVPGPRTQERIVRVLGY